MKPETLSKGLLLLTAAFPGFDFNAEIYWVILKDLKDEDFELAILDVIRTQKEIYPGTGLIAILYEKTNEIPMGLLAKALKDRPRTGAEIQMIADMQNTYEKIANRQAKRLEEQKKAKEFLKEVGGHVGATKGSQEGMEGVSND